MSRLSKDQMLEIIKQAIKESGWSLGVKKSTHPFILHVFKNDTVEKLRIYIWNITHGGLGRAVDEYRIQITGVPNIDVSPPFETLLLGFDRRYEVFAGYNPSRYTSFGSSPSLQVKEGTLETASKEGFALQPKEWDETGDITDVVVAFRPEQFMTYVENLSSYHKTLITEEVSLIQKAAEKPLSEDELKILPEERKKVVRKHSEAVRNTKFRRAVLQIYNQKCAICGLQLGIVEAAHIVPVSEGGTDEITNGIALCPNHHKTFDQGLFVITTNYEIFPLTDKIRALEEDNIHGGLNRFYEHLRANQQIYLPDDPKFYPKQQYLKMRMELEGFKLTL